MPPISPCFGLKAVFHYPEYRLYLYFISNTTCRECDVPTAFGESQIATIITPRLELDYIFPFSGQRYLVLTAYLDNSGTAVPFSFSFSPYVSAYLPCIH